MAKNDLIKVEPLDDNVPKLTLNPQFKQVLADMNQLTKRYHQLVDNVDLDQLDENQIDNLTKELAPMQKYYRQIEAAKKQMRKLFNDQRDAMTAQLDEILDQNGMNQLTEMDNTKKQLRRDLLNHRMNRRWDELSKTFDANMELYPNIKKFAPELMDFGNFRVQYPKLVSGAKNADVSDSQRSVINNTVAEWNQDLQWMMDNPIHLPNEYRGPLLKEWVENPSHENLSRLTTYYQQVASEQAQKLKAAEEANDEKKVEAAKLAMAKAGDHQQTPQGPVGEFNWLLDYAFANPNTKNITKDDAKASLIVMLSIGMTQPDSVFYKNIGKDYEKMLRAIRYILAR